MKTLRNVVITGTGMHVPEHVVTNKDLEQMMDTSDEWITQRSGIKERRWVKDGETPADLGVEACKIALNRAGRKTSDMDLLMVATLSPQHYFPGTAAFLQAQLGMETTPSMGVRCQCTGFLYALTTAKALVASGQYNKVLVCGIEVHSRALDKTTRGRDVTVLFGDGAGAVVVEEADEPERGILASTLHSDGRFGDKLWMEYPTLASDPHLNAQMIEDGTVYPKMEGRLVFKNAVSRLPEVVMETIKPLGLKIDDIDHFLFHQANLRINEHVAQLLKIPARKVHNNIEKYGNCSAASIPILLHETVAAGKIKKGDLVCMAAFGSGFTWGATLVRW